MTVDEVATAVREASSGHERFLVALAGPPATGKTTLSLRLLSALLEKGEAAALVAMDGFHLDNEVLQERGDLARKGAPHTFDAESFIKTVERLSEAADDISVPGFDRDLDRTVPGAHRVLLADRIVLVEGNYLLLNASPWDRLKDLFDLTIFVRTPIDVLEKRLVTRWTDHGLSEKEALARARQNDLPNARVVLDNSTAAALVLDTESIVQDMTPPSAA